MYFVGNHDSKKIVGDEPKSPNNFGFDDDKGNYNIVTGDHFLFRYEVISMLGSGSFGQAAKCFDHKT